MSGMSALHPDAERLLNRKPTLFERDGKPLPDPEKDRIQSELQLRESNLEAILALLATQFVRGADFNMKDFTINLDTAVEDALESIQRHVEKLHLQRGRAVEEKEADSSSSSDSESLEPADKEEAAEGDIVTNEKAAKEAELNDEKKQLIKHFIESAVEACREHCKPFTQPERAFWKKIIQEKNNELLESKRKAEHALRKLKDVSPSAAMALAAQEANSNAAIATAASAGSGGIPDKSPPGKGRSPPLDSSKMTPSRGFRDLVVPLPQNQPAAFQAATAAMAKKGPVALPSRQTVVANAAINMQITRAKLALTRRLQAMEQALMFQHDEDANMDSFDNGVFSSAGRKASQGSNLMRKDSTASNEQETSVLSTSVASVLPGPNLSQARKRGPRERFAKPAIVFEESASTSLQLETLEDFLKLNVPATQQSAVVNFISGLKQRALKQEKNENLIASIRERSKSVVSDDATLKPAVNSVNESSASSVAPAVAVAATKESKPRDAAAKTDKTSAKREPVKDAVKAPRVRRTTSPDRAPTVQRPKTEENDKKRTSIVTPSPKPSKPPKAEVLASPVVTLPTVLTRLPSAVVSSATQTSPRSLPPVATHVSVATVSRASQRSVPPSPLPVALDRKRSSVVPSRRSSMSVMTEQEDNGSGLASNRSNDENDEDILLGNNVAVQVSTLVVDAEVQVNINLGDAAPSATRRTSTNSSVANTADGNEAQEVVGIERDPLPTSLSKEAELLSVEERSVACAITPDVHNASLNAVVTVESIATQTIPDPDLFSVTRPFTAPLALAVSAPPPPLDPEPTLDVNRRLSDVLFAVPTPRSKLLPPLQPDAHATASASPHLGNHEAHSRPGHRITYRVQNPNFGVAPPTDAFNDMSSDPVVTLKNVYLGDATAALVSRQRSPPRNETTSESKGPGLAKSKTPQPKPTSFVTFDDFVKQKPHYL